MRTARRNDSLPALLGYGSLEAGLASIESFLRLYLLIFYTDVVGISAHWAGYAVAAGVLWDAVIDPLIGRLSDRTRSRFGARIPWIAIGTPCLVVAFAAMLFVPTSWSNPMQIAWLFITNIAVNTSMAVISIPHLALGSDMDSNKNIRTKIFAFRTMLSIVGLFCGIVIPAAARTGAWSFSSVTSDHVAAGIIIIFFVVTSLITTLYFLRLTKTHALTSTHQAANAQLFQVSLLRQPQYRKVAILMAAFFVATFGQGLNSSMALYYYKYRLNFSEAQLQMVLVIFMLVLVVSLPLWVKATLRFDKARLIAGGITGIGVLSAIAYPLLTPGVATGAIISAILGGIFLGCIGLLESLLTDLADAAGLNQQQHGFLFGIWKFLAKAARAAAIALSGQLLTWTGYTSHTQPSDHTINSIAMIFGPGVGVFFIAGGFLLWTIVKQPEEKLTLSKT